MAKRINRLWTDAFREIRRTLSRFLSLFLLSALAVAFLAGLRTTAPDMERTADAYYDAHGLMDVHILSTLGLTEEDIAVLAAQPGVRAAEGAYTADAMVHLEDNDLIVKLLSLSGQGINAPALRSGRMPETDRECLAEPALLDRMGLSLGDEIAFDTGDGAYADALRHQRFTVVGTADSPLYLSMDRGSSSLGTGRVNAFVLLPAGAFSMETYTDGYLLAEGAEELFCYGDGYEGLLDGLMDRLEPLSGQRAALRYDEVIGTANDALADAQRAFDEAEEEAGRTLNDARQSLEDARRELDEGWAAYRDGADTLARETLDAQRRIAEARSALPDALAELEQGEADLRTGGDDLAAGKRSYWDGLKDWQAGKADYDRGRQALLDGEAELSEGRQALLDGEQAYRDGRAAYLDGLDELEAAGKELEAAKAQLNQAMADIEAGNLELDEGYAQLQQARELYAALQPIYDEQLRWLTELLARLGLGPESSDEEIAEALSRYLDETITEDNAQETVDAFQGWVDGLPQEVLDQVPGEVLDYIGALTGDDLLHGKEEAKAHMLEAVAAARQTEEALAAQMESLAAQIAQGQARYDAGAAAFSRGKEQYEEGKRQYEAGLNAFQDGVAAAQDAERALAQARADLDEGWLQLAEGRDELDQGWAELDGAAVQLDDAMAQLEEAFGEIRRGEAELADARERLDEGWRAYGEGLEALSDAEERLPRETADARRTLDDAYRELTGGEAEYADGLAQYEQGRTEADGELSDARRQLNDARRAIRDIEHCTWYVLGRGTNMGYVSYQQDAQRMGNLASVFPLIFFLVAALVCLTTMTRMVEEQRIEIGGKKALGYGKLAISLKYVGYGFLASFAGGLVGLAVGCTLIPWVIFTAWKILYTVGDLVIPFYPGISALSVAAAVACVTLTAFAACFATLSAVPAHLMRPRAPKPGKRVLLERIRPLWKRLGFTWKVTVRNLFRYKKRFWMTVIGIGGCTALLIAGFGLRDSIYDIFDRQYDEITPYSAQVSLLPDVTDDELAEIALALDQEPLVERWTAASSQPVTAEGAKRSMESYVYLFSVPDQERFGEFVHLRHRQDGTAVELPGDGVVVTEKLAALLNLEPGDAVTLADGDGRRAEARVSALAENYVFHYIYLTADYYEALFGRRPEVNSLMVTYTEDTEENADAVAARLIPLAGVSSVSRIESTKQTFRDGMKGVDYGVLVITVAAAALAFVVLYNLTNINITERLRELATLKVLGFYNGELSSYVYRENLFLTLFGVLLGLGLGRYLHQWLVLTVEIDMVMFGRAARPMSYIYAVGLTLLFSFLVNLAARRRLKGIDMVESLKTVE